MPSHPNYSTDKVVLIKLFSGQLLFGVNRWTSLNFSIVLCNQMLNDRNLDINVTLGLVRGGMQQTN